MRYEKYNEVDFPWIKEVPEHWDFLRAKIISVSTKKINKNNVEDNVLSLTLKGVIRNSKDKPIGLSPSDYSTYQIFEKDDLVFKLIDLNNVRTSRVGIVHERGIMSSAYIRVTMDEIVNPKYAYYWYTKLYFEEVYNKLGSGVRETITKDELLDYSLPVPPLSEQEKIVNFLDWKINEIDKLIEIKNKESKLLDELKKTIITDAVTGKLYERKDIIYKKVDLAWVEEIPEHWELVPIKSLLENSFSGMWGNEKDSNLVELPCVRVADFNFSKIGIKDKIKTLRYYKESEISRRIRKGDILIEKSGGGAKTPVGRVAYNEQFDNYMCANFIQVLRLKENVDSKYIAYGLGAVFFSGYVKSFIKQTTGIQNLAMNQYLSQDFFIPPKEEQKQIVGFLDRKVREINELIKIKNSEIALLNDVKNKIISNTVTGQVDIRYFNIPKYERVEMLLDEDVELEEGEEEWD